MDDFETDDEDDEENPDETDESKLRKLAAQVCLLNPFKIKASQVIFLEEGITMLVSSGSLSSLPVVHYLYRQRTSALTAMMMTSRTMILATTRN